MDIELKRRHFVGVAAILLIAGTGCAYYLTRPKPTPWLDYPTDPEALITQFLKLVHEDTIPAHNQAYKLVNLPDQKRADDGHLQVYHDMNSYLTLLFDKGWADHITIIPIDPNKLYEVHIGTEVLHFDLAQQGPPDGPPTDHLGIVEVREFSLEDSAKAVQMAAAMGIIGGVGGHAAKGNMETIIGGAGNYSQMTDAQRKHVIIPIIMDPSVQGLRRTMLHLYKVHTDPTVVALMNVIKDNQQYPGDARDTARQIVEGTVDETELIAIGE